MSAVALSTARLLLASTAAAALMSGGLLTACGGGEVVAVLGVIGAAGGNFVVDTNGDGRRDGATENTGIVVTVSDPLAALYSTEYGVAYESFSLPGADCTGPKQGFVRGDRLDFGSCFQGRFEAGNVNRVSRTGGVVTQGLLFDTFSPQLAQGIWTDIRDSTRQVLFKNDEAGCELRSGVLTGNAVTIALQAADLAVGQYNDVAGMTIGSSTWTSGEHVGASGLRLQGGQGTLELQRQRYTGTAACP